MSFNVHSSHASSGQGVAADSAASGPQNATTLAALPIDVGAIITSYLSTQECCDLSKYQETENFLHVSIQHAFSQKKQRLIQLVQHAVWTVGTIHRERNLAFPISNNMANAARDQTRLPLDDVLQMMANYLNQANDPATFQERLIQCLNTFGPTIDPTYGSQYVHPVISHVAPALARIFMQSNTSPAAVQDRAISASASSSTGSLDDESCATRQDDNKEEELEAFRPEPTQPLTITLDDDFSCLRPTANGSYYFFTDPKM